MNAQIQQQLTNIEVEHNVKILYACESGSRAWGFPSADSDYDVRFLYVRPTDWYLRVDHQFCRDVIELPINDLLDINGWDLKKALLLLKKSNPSLIEWLNSPIVYRVNNDFFETVKELSNTLTHPLALFHHYRSMATGNYREYLKGEQVRIKKYFYVLRPILSMRWILAYKASPPIVFQELIESVIGDESLKQVVYDLIDKKRLGFETDYNTKIPQLSEFIDREIEALTQLAENHKQLHELLLDDSSASQNGGFSDLNSFFLSVVSNPNKLDDRNNG